VKKEISVELQREVIERSMKESVPGSADKLVATIDDVYDQSIKISNHTIASKENEGVSSLELSENDTEQDEVSNRPPARDKLDKKKR